MKTLADISNKQKTVVMLGVMLAILLSALDQMIVATAMPKIVREFNGLEHLSWVFTAYMLTSTVTVPIYGKLSDIYGRKYFFLGGILIFLLGSVLSGQSHSMNELILFRALQGIGGGAMMANAFTIIADLFPPAERGKWQGMIGGVFGLASVIGPTLGGYLTDSVSWRWCFYVNIPVGILALLVIWFLMPKTVSHITGKRSIDYLGAIALTLGLTPLLLGLVWGGNQFPWISWQIIGSFVFSLIFLSAFIFIEKKVKEPIIPLFLFKNRTFSVSVIITFLIAMGMFGATLYIPFFAQGVLGVSATNSGIILLPLMLGLIFSSIASGQIISRTGKYKFLAVIGAVIVTLGMLSLSFLNPNTSQAQLYLRMIFLGIGLGITMPIFTIAVQNAFSREHLGVVTASTQLFRSIGGTVGTAIMGSILNNALLNKISNADLSQNPFVQVMAKINPQSSIDKLNANSLQGFLSSDAQNKIISQLKNLPVLVQPSIMQGYNDFLFQIKNILASSIDEIFLITTLLMITTIIASFFLPEVPLRKSEKKQTIAEQAGIEIALEEGEFSKI